MFDVGFWEMAFIGVIALLVIGPERLPGVARNVGAWVGKGRRMINDVKADIKKEMREEDLKSFRELKSEVTGAGQNIRDMARETVDSTGITEATESLKESVESVSGDLKEGMEVLNETASAAETPTSGKTSAADSH